MEIVNTPQERETTLWEKRKEESERERARELLMQDLDCKEIVGENSSSAQVTQNFNIKWNNTIINPRYLDEEKKM